MTEAQTAPILPLLIQLSKLDSRLAVLQAQIVQVEKDQKQRTQALLTVDQQQAAKAKVLAEKKELIAREEKGIKLERDKINDRRRALGTLNNYKLQQAAEREIDYVSKQIGQREDLLLALMREVETLEKGFVEVGTSLDGIKQELAVFEKAADEKLADCRVQVAELQTERQEQAKAIGDAQLLASYNRIASRFPSDPIVDVVNRESCAGCFMRVGPQVPVQISRGLVVKCPGCGRILKLPVEG